MNAGMAPRGPVYLSGPMTGLPDFNYPAFHDAAQRLRSIGHRVESPAENPPPARRHTLAPPPRDQQIRTGAHAASAGCMAG